MQWVSIVKYLGLYFTNSTDFKIDLTVAKRKYYGCFNTIKGRVERIFFFASFKLPLFNEYEMVFISLAYKWC